MDFPLSRAVAENLIVLPEVGSTNDELVARATGNGLPEFTAVVTTNQTAGRGRLDRTWVAPPGQALAVSVLLGPILPDGTKVPLDRYGWISLIAGLAMTRAIRRLVVGHDVSLKWPNDVLIDGRKVSGLLSELLPSGRGVVVGAGLNLTIPHGALPVPSATSLLLNGVDLIDDLADRALAGYLRELRTAWSAFLAAGADADASGIRSAVSDACSTLGQPVRVSLPGGAETVGTAIDIDDDGRLRIRSATDTQLQTVAAGDITHLRYE